MNPGTEQAVASPDVRPNGASLNGSAKQDGQVAAKPEAGARNERRSQFAQSFAQIVGVLMRDPRFKNMRLSDLQWLVVPPLLTGQMRLAHAQTRRNGFYLPVAVALWARVSDAVDKRLSENAKGPIQLRPSEWCSGDNYWLIAVAGDPRATPMFIKQLEKTEFNGKRVKMWTQDRERQASVKTLDEITASR